MRRVLIHRVQCAAQLRRRLSSRFASLDSLKTEVGKELGWSSFIDIDADRVRRFADATSDWQWIHLDEERAKRESEFGGPVAHGFLSLSLVVPFLDDVVGDIGGTKTKINIGVNRVRFVAPVLVGDRLRAKFTLLQLDDVQDGRAAQATYGIECWTEGAKKPAVIVESIIRYLRDV